MIEGEQSFFFRLDRPGIIIGGDAQLTVALVDYFTAVDLSEVNLWLVLLSRKTIDFMVSWIHSVITSSRSVAIAFVVVEVVVELCWKM